MRHVTEISVSGCGPGCRDTILVTLPQGLSQQLLFLKTGESTLPGHTPLGANPQKGQSDALGGPLVVVSGG